MKNDHMCGKEVHHVNNNITRLQNQNAEQETNKTFRHNQQNTKIYVVHPKLGVTSTNAVTSCDLNY